MNCDRAAELLVDYSEGALSARKKRALQGHLSGCKGCRAELSQIERVKERLLSLDAPERDAEFWRRFGVNLSERLEGEKHVVTDRRLLWRALAPAAGGLLALLLLAGSRCSRPLEAVPAAGQQPLQQTPAGTVDVVFRLLGGHVRAARARPGVAKPGPNPFS